MNVASVDNLSDTSIFLYWKNQSCLVPYQSHLFKKGTFFKSLYKNVHSEVCWLTPGSWGCFASHCLLSGILIQRWPSSLSVSRRQPPPACFVPRHWTVPWILGQANWTSVMKLITHMHAHSSTQCCHQCQVSQIYGNHLLLPPLSKKCDSCGFFWCMRHAPLCSIIGKWQRWTRGHWLMLVTLSLLSLLRRVCETIPTKWPQSTNMAPVSMSWFTSDNQHKMFIMLDCCQHFGTLSSYRVCHNMITFIFDYHWEESVKRCIKKYGMSKYVKEHC